MLEHSTPPPKRGKRRRKQTIVRAGRVRAVRVPKPPPPRARRVRNDGVGAMVCGGVTGNVPAIAPELAVHGVAFNE